MRVCGVSWFAVGMIAQDGVLGPCDGCMESEFNTVNRFSTVELAAVPAEVMFGDAADLDTGQQDDPRPGGKFYEIHDANQSNMRSNVR